MKHEFKVKQYKDATVYTLESATGGGTSAGAVASISKPMGNVIKRGGLITQEGDSVTVPVKQKPRQGALKTQTGAGAHRDKKKEQKQGKEKHKKPYMEDIATRIEVLKAKLDEVSLGDYQRKAKMASALAKMGAAFGNDPASREKELDIARRRDAGIGRAQARYDKIRAASDEKNRADSLARDKANLPQMKAELEKLQGQFDPNFEYSDDHSFWRQQKDIQSRIHSLKQTIARAEEVDEDAPFLAKAAGGLALGALGAAGAPAIVGLLGPVIGTALAAYGAYNSAKGGMWAVDKLWDLAARKLGGQDKAEQFAKAHAVAASRGEDSFNYAGKEFPVKLKQDQVKPAIQAIKQVSEDHSTVGGWGKGSYDTYSGTHHGRGVMEDEFMSHLETVLNEEKQRLDPSCWKGYKKQGTKMKGGVRVNNCVPKEDIEATEAANPAQQAAIAIAKKKKGLSEDAELNQKFDIIESMIEDIAAQNGVDVDQVWEDVENIDDQELLAEAEAWQTSKGKSKSGGLNKKGVASYRRSHPGSKLQTAVTTKPSKLKKGSKAAKRRKSFCARMSGVKGPMKKPNGKPTRKALALRKWNCHEDAYVLSVAQQVSEKLNPQADVDVWVQDFQKADPNKYHQFKNKTPQKKAQMAVAAHYAANEPSKKK
jgi:hypothetical protein